MVQCRTFLPCVALVLLIAQADGAEQNGHAGIAASFKRGLKAVAPAPAPVGSLDSISVAVRGSTDGSACRLPLYVGGTLVTNCSDDAAADAQPRQVCYTSGLNSSSTCSASSTTTTIGSAVQTGQGLDGQEGSLCVLVASQAQCVSPYGCTAASSPPLAGSSVGYCAPVSTPSHSSSASAPASTSAGSEVAVPIVRGVAVNSSLGVANISAVLVAGRTTGSGAQCKLPVVYAGQLLTDCLQTAQGEMCIPEGSSAMQPCSQQAGASTELSQLLLTGSLATDGTLGSLCSPTAESITGGPTLCRSGSYCRVDLNSSLANTGIGFCAAIPATGANAASPFAGYQVASRNDAAFDPCRLPLVYQGSLLLDCVTLSSSSQPSCFTSSNLTAPPVPCVAPDPYTVAPLQTALAAGGSDGLLGSLCQLQTPNISDLASMACTGGLACTALQGPFTSSGYGYCSTVQAAPAPAPGQSSPAVTPPAVTAGRIAPQPATAPAPVLVASLSALQITQRNTTSGASCLLPMVVHGLLLADCYPNGTAPVCFPDGQTAAACSAQNGQQAGLLSLQEAHTLSQGSLGQLCSLDLQATGADLPCMSPLACVAASTGLLLGSGYGYCSQLSDLMGAKSFAALNSVQVAARTSLSGAACDLPLGVNGSLLTDCSQGTCWVAGQQEACSPVSTGGRGTSVASAMAAEVGLKGSAGSLCSTGNQAGLRCGQQLQCSSFAQGGNGAALAGAGVGFCASPQSQHVTVADKGNHCGGGCVAGIVIIGIAIVAGLAVIGLMALRARQRAGSYDRFNDQPLAMSAGRGYTSQEAEVPRGAAFLAAGPKQRGGMELEPSPRPFHKPAPFQQF